MTEASRIKYPDPGELKGFLDEMTDRYNNVSFIDPDPISIPHKFSSREDIEIAGFMVAAIAWGRRDLILRSAGRMMEIMGNTPYDFVMSANDSQTERLSYFVHRTFNGVDAIAFVEGLKSLYTHFKSPEEIILTGMKGSTIREGLASFRDHFFSIGLPKRSEKHFANVQSGSSGKRLNMYLRWMVRRDKSGVDFGLWDKISPSGLFIPLDVHSGTISRKLGLLERKQNDWKAVEELTANLRLFDAIDPVKYDFALFGLGVNRDF